MILFGAKESVKGVARLPGVARSASYESDHGANLVGVIGFTRNQQPDAIQKR